MGTLVLGLGNPILTDDGIGIHIVRRVAACLQRDDVVFAEASIGGLRLLDAIAGYHQVIMVDAIQSGGEPGAICSLQPGGPGASGHSGSTHDLSLSGALALGRSLGMTLPDDKAIEIIAVEVEDVLTFGEACTPAVEASIPRAVELVLAGLEERDQGSVVSCTCSQAPPPDQRRK